MIARLVYLLPFVGLGLVILTLPLPISAAPTTREVSVNAEQYAFNPPVLRVNRGDRVVLNIQATDVVHGLYVDDYGIDVRVEPGISQQVDFVADKVGKFRYRCSVACGTLHPFMIGELVVAPNRPYLRALALAIVVGVATLFYLWRFPPRQAVVQA